MRVRMKTQITGYRDGEPWPPVGGTLDLPDHEAADLEAAGYAERLGRPSADRMARPPRPPRRRPAKTAAKRAPAAAKRAPKGT